MMGKLYHITFLTALVLGKMENCDKKNKFKL